GTYTATATNLVAETVTITGTLDGTDITDDADITFTAGVPDPTNTNTTITATSPVTADGIATSTITVQLADTNGNPLTSSGGTVVLSSTGSAI
uniref:invasin domain 3-containing protein n=1 Tax=uncultured Croceitalea sp. TaxID=1798908 RepID=UPI00330691E8